MSVRCAIFRRSDESQLLHGTWWGTGDGQASSTKTGNQKFWNWHFLKRRHLKTEGHFSCLKNSLIPFLEGNTNYFCHDFPNAEGALHIMQKSPLTVNWITLVLFSRPFMPMADVWRLEDYSPDYKMLLGFCLKSGNAKGWKMLLDNTKQRYWCFSSAEQKGEI